MPEFEGIFSAIDENERVEPAETETTETETNTNTKTEAETQVEAENKNKNDEVAESTTAEVNTKPEPGTEAESEPSKTETNTDAEIDWKAQLPPPPQPYLGPAPILNEDGNITNMTPEQYHEYLQETMLARVRQEGYQDFVHNASLDAAEKILPQLKESQAVRNMVENAVTASIINGNQIDAYEAAKQVREALGIAPEKIAQAKAEGAQNAKVSITNQKVAAVETGGGAKKSTSSVDADIAKRASRGDENAIAELIGVWDAAGKL